MVEAFNWRIRLGIRRDLCLLRAKKSYWDKNLAPCVMETAPEWCKGVVTAPVQTVVDREDRESTVREMLELDFNGVVDLSSPETFLQTRSFFTLPNSILVQSNFQDENIDDCKIILPVVVHLDSIPLDRYCIKKEV